MSDHVIGIDIGGTTCRAGLVDQHNTIVDSTRRTTPRGLDELLNWVSNTYLGWSKSQPSSIPMGLAFPGVIDLARGTLVRSVNLSWLEGQPIVQQLKNLIEQRIALMTDADAATWGEYIACGSPAGPFGHLRLGTGVACGIVVNGNMIPADPARRTHWPILIVDPSETAPACRCGLRGCLEVFASGKSLVDKAQGLGLSGLTDLEAGHRSGKAETVFAVEEAAHAIWKAIRNLRVHFGVETVVLGGGVIEGLPLLFDLICEVSRLSAREGPAPGIVVRNSQLGDEAGVIGAARLASNQQSRS